MASLKVNEPVSTDGELVALSRQGNKDAFGLLIKRHYQTCVNIASFVLRDRGEAQDEVQKACWKAFEHLDQFQGEAEFLTWLLRIVTNQCLMLMRVRKRVQFSYLDADRAVGRNSIELPTVTPDPEQQAVRRNMQQVLQREIRRIPLLLRNVILLRDVEELPMMDVARRLKITVPAAKSRLLRARIELRKRVMRECGGGGAYKSYSQAPPMPAKRSRRVAWMT
jgi:RNA polymerase sigma-70 factor (ECF subfamily)